MTEQNHDQGQESVTSAPAAKLLELLVCPFTKGPLKYDRAAARLLSKNAHLAFPIKDGVPIMTREAAISLDDLPPKP